MLLVFGRSLRCNYSNYFKRQQLENTLQAKMSSGNSAKSPTLDLEKIEYKTEPEKYEKQIPQLRRQKLQNIKESRKNMKQQSFKNAAPGSVNLQILGNGANGAPSSIYLFTDQSRYLFNCGEGTQRLAHEHKTKLSRLERIFVTRNSWPMIGGIPGLALTVQDVGVKDISLHGPPFLESVLNGMRYFVVLRSLKMNTVDATQDSEMEDSVMTVKSVPIFRGTDASSNICDQDKVVIAYNCKLKPRAGALNLEKCVEYGVQPGPLLGLLKSGTDVTLDDGTVVKSKDVCDEPEKPLSFVILDIPSEDFLSELQSKSNEIFNEDLRLIVHFSPVHVLENECFKELMQNLPASTQHLCLNATHNVFSGYVAAQRLQYHLNQLNPRVFPLLAESTEVLNTFSNTKIPKKAKFEEGTNIKNVGHDKECLNSLTSFHLRPLKGIDRSMEAKLNPAEYIEETKALEDFPILLEKLKMEMSNITLSSNGDEYPKITFLGTGSCVPNKTRNVSAILVQSAADSYFILDCGEGTLGQIERFFGQTKAKEVIRNLKGIYVSHLHADHHIGLIGLINERQRLLCDKIDGEKLLVFAPRQIEPWLKFYDSKIASISNSFELIGNAQMLENPLRFAENYPSVGLETIQTCLVRHCPHSFGVRLTLKRNTNSDRKPVSITYSGDTMPCRDLIELGRNTTILIHEATMEDDLVEEARLKMHSTISEAIEQGRNMEADHIILTHFSQRYAKLPRMRSTGESGSTIDEETVMRNVSIAFDNMHITLSDLEHFHILYPALRALFAEHAEELEQKALKRELKLERKRKLLNEN